MPSSLGDFHSPQPLPPHHPLSFSLDFHMPTVSRVVCPHIDSGIKAVSREEASKKGTVVQALSRPAYSWHRVHGALYDVPETSFSQVVRCFPEVSALTVFYWVLGNSLSFSGPSFLITNLKNWSTVPLQCQNGHWTST